MAKTGYLYSEKFLEHSIKEPHPERPDRLIAIQKKLEENGLINELQIIEAEEASVEELELIHDPRYIAKLKRASLSATGKPFYLDPDTYITNKTFGTLLNVIGGIANTVDYCIKGGGRFAFCAVRPPGHHAFEAHGGGFCLLNNIAYAARYAQREYEFKRVLILDWDTHHGNGTQSIFYSDPSVYYISCHEEENYPGGGNMNERGKGKGIGFNRNFPLPLGCTDTQYRELFTDYIGPIIKDFKPELTLISAGFDSHADDPLGHMELSSKAYGDLTKITIELSGNAPIISILEGGYDLNALAESVYYHIKAFTEA